MLTVSEQLQELHKRGWRDERVATWIGDRYRLVLDSHAATGPSSQSVYRWRRGQTQPSEFHTELISELYLGEIHDEENHRN